MILNNTTLKADSVTKKNAQQQERKDLLLS